MTPVSIKNDVEFPLSCLRELDSGRQIVRRCEPTSYEIESLSENNGLGEIKSICSTIISEGGFDPIGIPFSISNNSDKTVNTTELPLIAIRLKNEYNKSLVRLFDYNIGTTTNNPPGVIYKIRKYISPDVDPLSGGSWADVNSKSFVQYRYPTSFTGDNYTLIEQFSSQKSNIFTGGDIRNIINLTSNIQGDKLDIIILTAESFSGDISIRSSISWTEVH